MVHNMQQSPLAGKVALVASPQSYVNGANLTVDGGVNA